MALLEKVASVESGHYERDHCTTKCLTLCSMVVCCVLSRWTLMSLDPSNLIRIRFPTISAGKHRSSKMASCTAVRVRLQDKSHNINVHDSATSSYAFRLNICSGTPLNVPPELRALPSSTQHAFSIFSSLRVK